MRPVGKGLAVRLAAGAALALVVGLFLVLKAYALNIHPSDEGIYFYGGLRMSQGALPYRDFFFAHPPLHLLPFALLFKLFGYSFGLAKAVPFFWAASTGVAVFMAVGRLAADAPPWRRHIAALLAAGGLLFTETLLKASSTATGINQTTALLLWSAVLFLHARPRLGAAAAGAATMTLLQGAPFAAILLAASILTAPRGQRRRAAADVALGFGGTVAAATLFGLLAGGWRFVEQVILFHLDKPERAGEGARQLGFVIFDNWTLLAAAAVCALLVAWSGDRKARVVLVIALAVCVAQFAAMATRPRVYPFYFLPALASLAPIVGWGLATLSRRRPAPIATGALIFVFLLYGPLPKLVSPARVEQIARYTQTYTWWQAPIGASLNALVRTLFWQGGVRRAGVDSNAVTQYLWQRSRALDTHQAMVAALKEIARVDPRASLFGDSTTAPQVALDAGVLIAGDLVDTNQARFAAGNLKLSDVSAMLEAHPAAILLLSPTEGIGSRPEIAAWVQTHFEAARSFTSASGARHVLWRRPSGKAPLTD